MLTEFLLGLGGLFFLPSLPVFCLILPAPCLDLVPALLTVPTPLQSSSVQPIPGAVCMWHICQWLKSPPLIQVPLKPHLSGQTWAPQLPQLTPEKSSWLTPLVCGEGLSLPLPVSVPLPPKQVGLDLSPQGRFTRHPVQTGQALVFSDFDLYPMLILAGHPKYPDFNYFQRNCKIR